MKTATSESVEPNGRFRWQLMSLMVGLAIAAGLGLFLGGMAPSEAQVHASPMRTPIAHIERPHSEQPSSVLFLVRDEQQAEKVRRDEELAEWVRYDSNVMEPNRIFSIFSASGAGQETGIVEIARQLSATNRSFEVIDLRKQ